MNRRRPEFQAIDLAAWPTVAYTEFDHEARCAFEARMQALVRYARGDSLKQIEQSTGVDRRQLYRWLERALSPHSDGRPVGFRALVSYLRVAEYVRLTPARQLRRRRRAIAAFRALPYPRRLAAAPGQTASRVARADQHRWAITDPLARAAATA